MKTFVIGDIHGCFDELVELLETLDLDWSVDKLIFLGDYIDRGGKSFEVVQLVRSLRQEHGRDKVIALKGNHEQMAIDYYEEGNERWFRNGAEATVESFVRHGEQVQEYLEFFKSLQRYYEDEKYIFVHAGIRPGVKLSEQSARDLEWIRDEFYLHTHACDKTVVFGHTPTRTIKEGDYPLEINGNIAVDTACVYGGALSAIEFVTGSVSSNEYIVHQVKSTMEMQDE